MQQTMSSHVLLNSGLIESDLLNFSKETSTPLDIYDDTSTKNSKFNSFPMRLKKQSVVSGTGGNAAAAKLRPEPKSSSSIEYKATTEDYIVLSEEELSQAVRNAYTRAPDNAKLKQILRNNYWSYKHPMRNYLWKCLLKQTSSSKNANTDASLSTNDKENDIKNDIYCNENEYNNHLNHIFGKCKFC